MKMKINSKSSFSLKIIDFINNQYWLTAALSITLSGIAVLWGIGLIFVFSIQSIL